MEAVLDERYREVLALLRSSGRIIDLGCGNVPVQGACVAVDRFVAPEQRALGHGQTIDEDRFRERGIRFVNQRIDVPLPFGDKEFDFAYSAHVFEHLEDPATACREMMRIAKAGVIITPSAFAEVAFGRPYHRWLVTEGDGTILFFGKRPAEDRPFGEHPEPAPGGGYRATESTNVFDIALNDGGWHPGTGCREMERLGGTLRRHYLGHTPVFEVVFLWRDAFRWQVFPRGGGA